MRAMIPQTAPTLHNSFLSYAVCGWPVFAIDRPTISWCAPYRFIALCRFPYYKKDGNIPEFSSRNPRNTVHASDVQVCVRERTQCTASMPHGTGSLRRQTNAFSVHLGFLLPCSEIQMSPYRSGKRFLSIQSNCRHCQSANNDSK